MRTPSLLSLKFFEVCAHYQNFEKAANHLHVTQSAVSKQIKTLEESLNCRLFTRRNRGVFLTEDGLWLANKLTPIFADMESVINAFHENRTDNRLVVSCEPTVCLRFLLPLLQDLKEDTGLTIKILAAGGKVDFKRDAVDIAIRRNDFVLDPHLDIEVIAKEFIGPIHIVDYNILKSGKTASMIKIHSKTRPNAWHYWQQKNKILTHSIEDVVFEHFYLALEAAASGQGVAMASIHMVYKELQQGRFIAPFGFIEDGSSYLCLSQTPFAQDKRKILFMEWMRQKMAKNIAYAQTNDTI